MVLARRTGVALQRWQYQWFLTSSSTSDASLSMTSRTSCGRLSEARVLCVFFGGGGGGERRGAESVACAPNAAALS